MKEREEENYNLENYERFLGDIKEDGVHWEKIQKRTATLFQVLLDEDLKELVFLLEHYPKYIGVVCEHFRYLYNYSNKRADIFAASKLLYMSKEYHQKQFIRNLLRKLEDINDYDITKLKTFLENLMTNQEKIHPIILGYYKGEISNILETSNYHKLQKIALQKLLKEIDVETNYDYSASDRDANLDIPYMV